MNFPVWQFVHGTSGISGGFLIALIAVIHVFVAQFAVGGGAFLLLAEWKAHRENSPRLLRWVHRHTKFFLLLTMVFGGLTGVGIWLIISLVSPAGISLLVGEFLYAWAAEWVFFLGEIIALLLYAASFKRCRQGRMAPRDHMILGAGYLLFAMLSLFMINGILTFMLTPPDLAAASLLPANAPAGSTWAPGSDFWRNLFNPGFWPGLVFRSGLCLTLSGLFGLVTATALEHTPTRLAAIRFCAAWVCLPFIIMAVGAYWYIDSLPQELRGFMLRTTDDIRPFVRSFTDTAPLLFLAGMAFFAAMPQRAHKGLVIAAFAFGLITAGSFEWMRETARRPWLIYGYMYSNGIVKTDAEKAAQDGMAAHSGWLRLVEAANAEAAATAERPKNIVTASSEARKNSGAAAPSEALNSAEAARAAAERRAKFLFAQQCSNCHGVNRPMLNLIPRIASRGEGGLSALIGGQGFISPYMPPFAGNEEDRAALAKRLAGLVARNTAEGGDAAKVSTGSSAQTAEAAKGEKP